MSDDDSGDAVRDNGDGDDDSVGDGDSSVLLVMTVMVMMIPSSRPSLHSVCRSMFLASDT